MARKKEKVAEVPNLWAGKIVSEVEQSGTPDAILSDILDFKGFKTKTTRSVLDDCLIAFLYS